jgi:phosphoribosylformylglycinamidine synthase
VDLAVLPATLDAVHAAIAAGQVLACHDVSEGGLLVALAEMAFGGEVGVALDVAGLAARADVALFNETAGVFVVEVDRPETAIDAFGDGPLVILGHTVPEPVLRAHDGQSRLFELPLDQLRAAWSAPLAAVFHGG